MISANFNKSLRKLMIVAKEDDLYAQHAVDVLCTYSLAIGSNGIIRSMVLSSFSFYRWPTSLFHPISMMIVLLHRLYLPPYVFGFC